jgi:PAS domain S-box-containing protein
MRLPIKWLKVALKYFTSSIRRKIILPYAVLTLMLAIFGVFIVTRLVAGSFEARLKNQLLQAGRVVSDEIVNQERVRLTVERSVANTEGVAEALVDRDYEQLNELIAPIIGNHRDIDGIMVINAQGKEVLRLQRNNLAANTPAQTSLNSGADFFSWPAVRRALAGTDNGAKEIQVAQDPKTKELIIYTIGPVQTSNGIVGAVLIGTYLKKQIDAIKKLALVDITLFDEKAQVVYSTLVNDPEQARQIFQVFTPERYHQVIRLQEVTLLDEILGPEQTTDQEVSVRGQTYRLGYAPFLLRGQIYGVYAVALPTNFITDTNDQSRNILSLVFTVGVVLVFGIGYLVSRRIIKPITRLVQTAQAIAKGDLDQRTRLQEPDEIGILATTFDNMTSELQRLLKIQREEASKLNAILTSIADGVIVQDLAGNTVIMNPAAENILQTMEENFLPQPQPQALLPEPRADDSAATFLSNLTGLDFRESRRFEVGQRTLSALSAPVMTSEKEQLGSVVVLRDISREVESEKLKDDFITSISHELRTPLTAIKGYNQLLGMMAGAKLDERELNFIATIDKNVEDLLQLIQEMLDLSQINAGTLGIDHESLDFSELVETETQKWVEKMAEKDLSFAVHIPEQPVWVEGDRSRLVRVINNLISNAYDYTLPGGQVEIRVTADNSHLQTDIIDSGVGIAPEHQRFLFTRFFRAIHEESTYEVSGAGLGLYISKAIIEAHNGQIWMASSEVNRGSTFSFTLPLIDLEHVASLTDEPIEQLETDNQSV